MELNEILTIALKGGASDIHLKAGLPPIFRIDGSLVPLKDAPRLPPEEVARMALGIMNNYQKEKFKDENEIDLAYGVPGLGRFRVNVFMQRGAVGVVLRVIPFKILTIEQLMLPKVLEKIALEERGLILVTGTTGSGKSTTLAGMIDHINTNQTCHILTVEDPIEFLIRDKRSIVNQREVGVDTRSFARALKSALREDPDVILVGEMRDLETMEMGLTAAETGHLVLSTLHTMDATETIARVVNVFPPYQQKQVRLVLATVLRSVLSQRLVARADGRGRVAALEIMVTTARTRELIEDKDRTKELHDAIAQGNVGYGMQTFDQALMGLLARQLITYEEALKQSSNPDDFALKVSGISGTSDQTWGEFDPSKAKGGGHQQGQPQQAPMAPPQQAAPYMRPPTPQAQGAPPGGYSPAARPGQPQNPPPYMAPPGNPNLQHRASASMPLPSAPPIPPAAPRPGMPSNPPIPAPQGQKPASEDDDFQIERF
jgi:twitching motility protein PilT